ncbi:hypothetical protein LTR62_007763 [Meristemomyces frigidus]|uniref:Zn(2)-C6 fungal-type domain-containing protein n=1 Tax=Meristemomyces frigidus TaxID=1508187 RepID=A0AAN7TBC0_9PEZI|nr:hypothetical protein LTR62_007763 [Meristemomyces frigidus]
MPPSKPFAVEPEGKLPKRISTTNACVECRRRKIRCDGNRPCGQCGWYQHPQRCVYSKRIQREAPSRKALDKLQGDLDNYRSIVSRMFPGQGPETLGGLPREQLIDLAMILPASHLSPSVHSEPVLEPAPHYEGTRSPEDADSLDALEEPPERDPKIDEAKRHKHKVNAISDDVNALSLSVDKQSSYVGISSISAALKVIFKTVPTARLYINQTYDKTVPPSRSTSPPAYTRNLDPYYLPSPDVGQKLIESYFNHVDVQMPMIDEDHFWRTWLYGHRRDSPWLALLNMVMALGSLAGSTCEDEEHHAYFQRARKHLDLEAFGSSDILMLQAMGLFSGYYLHYLNRPNEANCLMGATLRMATALGLHREYNDSFPARPASHGVQADKSEIPADIRRRTWWTLFCLDAWGSVSIGRPSLGRMGLGVTAEIPKIPPHMNNAQYIATLRLLPLVHNIEFCKLATRIQDSLAARPLTKLEDLFAFDAELVKWHDELPPIIRAPSTSSTAIQRSHPVYEQPPATQKTPLATNSSELDPMDLSSPADREHIPCPDILQTPRAIMHWRYQNLRMLMHRPYLLSAALRRTPVTGMNTEENIAVTRCRIIAGQIIADVDVMCREELIAGWAAVWQMYQAVMVPLVSLFSYISTLVDDDDLEPNEEKDSFSGANDQDVQRWEMQIETALRFFNRMRSFSVAATKSRDVVERLYEASKHVQRHPEQQTQSHHYVQDAGLDASQAATICSIHGDKLQAYSHERGQTAAFGESFWGPGPDCDAATEACWDDMLWATLPEVGDWGQEVDHLG